MHSREPLNFGSKWLELLQLASVAHTSMIRREGLNIVENSDTHKMHPRDGLADWSDDNVLKATL